jgi:hypothetical protein
MPGNETAPEMERDVFAEKLFRSVLGYFEIFSIHLGARLGLYRALAEAGPMTSQELGERAGVSERHAREWLEQQATAGILTARSERTVRIGSGCPPATPRCSWTATRSRSWERA